MLDNQRPLENYNLFRTDRVLREAVARQAPDGLNGELTVLGELGGRAETIALGFDANEHPPQLRTHDRLSRPDPCRARASDPPRNLPPCVRQSADRSAADAERAGRPRAGVGGRNASRPARRADDRRFAEVGLGIRAQAHRDRARKVLHLQASPGDRRGSPRVVGGNGYVEESIVPRLYREAPLNSIGKVRETSTRSTSFAYCKNSPRPLPRGAPSSKTRATSRLSWRSYAPSNATCARRRCSGRYATGFVAEAFLRSRLGAAGRTLGTLPPGLEFRNVIDRAAPVEAA